MKIRLCGAEKRTVGKREKLQTMQGTCIWRTSLVICTCSAVHIKTTELGADIAGRGGRGYNDVIFVWRDTSSLLSLSARYWTSLMILPLSYCHGCEVYICAYISTLSMCYVAAQRDSEMAIWYEQAASCWRACFALLCWAGLALLCLLFSLAFDATDRTVFHLLLEQRFAAACRALSSLLSCSVDWTNPTHFGYDVRAEFARQTKGRGWEKDSSRNFQFNCTVESGELCLRGERVGLRKTRLR